MAEGDLPRTVGRNLRRVREALGLSQEEFAERLGVHRTYVGGVERGERNLSLRSVERLAGQVNLPALQLLVETTPTDARASGAAVGVEDMRPPGA